MADEKLNTSPEENPQPSLFDTGPAEAPTPEPPAPEKAPEQAAGEPPAQDAPAGAPGEVNVSADQIEKLMAERRAAERAKVENWKPGGSGGVLRRSSAGRTAVSPRRSNHWYPPELYEGRGCLRPCRLGHSVGHRRLQRPGLYHGLQF